MKTSLGEIVSISISKYFLDNIKDEVKDIKMKCLSHPEKFLWTSTTKNFPSMIDIFNHIKNLKYEDRPDYNLIRTKLREVKFTGLTLKSSLLAENIF